MAKRSKKKKTPGKVSAASAIAKTPAHEWPWALLLFVAVVVAYLPVWKAGYVWDDDLMLTANPCIVGPLGLQEIWTTQAADICPLTLTTLWAAHKFWALDPLPYHLLNVFLHGCSAIVLWRVLRLLAVPGAWLGAALWALHPVQVESVAWIAEIKNVQSGVFFLLAILFFLRWLKAPVQGWDWNYAAAMIFAACAMASKSSTVILPVSLCLCAWWMEGRLVWRTVAKTVPIFLMSIIAAAVSIWTQHLQTLVATDTPASRSWPERLATAGDAVWFYLVKLVWPRPLIAIYPRWIVDSAAFTSYLPLLAVILLVVILWCTRTAWGRPWFFVFIYFLIALLPALGLADNFIFRYSPVFDHFQYLASMGPLALVGAGLTRWLDVFVPEKSAQRVVFCTCAILSLAMLTWQRTTVYQSSESLWTDTLVHNPNTWIAHSNLGQALYAKGDADGAIRHYEIALQMEPRSAETHYNLGAALFQKGRVDEAISHYRSALQIYPSFPEAHCNLATALLQKGQFDDAIAHYQAVIATRPGYADAYYGLGNALAKKGQMADAIVPFEKVVELEPDKSEAHNNLGAALYQTGATEKALSQFEEAVRLDPNNTAAQTNLAKATARLGKERAK